MQLKENKLFCYNTDQLDEENIKPTEVFNLNINRYRVSIHNITNEKFYLIDETNNKSRTFKAESETERTEWVKQIQNSCKRIRRNTYDNKLLSIDPNDYMAQLVYNRKLFPIKSTDNQQFTHIFDKYSALICCCVSPKSRAIPYSAFESTHYIYFQYKHIELKKDKRKESFNANNYQTQTRFAYFLIHISYYQLAEIDKLIKKNNKNGKMFGDEYPQPLQETKNKRGDLHKQYLCEESLVTKSILPIGPSKLIKRYMTTKDVKEYATYLHKILNCSELLLMDELYDILDICDPEIINLFKLLAYTKLKTLSSVANEYDLCNVCRDPTKLKTKHDITFHTLWIVKRPLNNRKAALLGCDHWALKWEGNDHLMTSGFFSYNDKHGIILTKIVANSPLNRRLFWYYWSRDNNSNEIEPQHFNSRWIVLEKLYLGEISCALIGSLIEEWLSYNNHAKYDLRSNNCQDYVCHMVAPLDINISKRLTSAYDIKMAQSLIPAGILCQGIDAQAKCNSARTRLWPILFKYQKDMKLKKQKQNCISEQQTFEENLKFCANQLGISLSLSQSVSEKDIICQEEKDTEIGDIIGSSSYYNGDNTMTNSNAILGKKSTLSCDYDINQQLSSNCLSLSLSQETQDEQDIKQDNICINDNEFTDTIKKALSNNIIGDAIKLTQQLLNVTHLWQDITISYPLDGDNHSKNNESLNQSISTSSGSSDNKQDSHDDNTNGDRNGNNNNNNNNNNNKKNNKKNCNLNEYKCNIPWHETRLKELEDEIKKIEDKSYVYLQNLHIVEDQFDDNKTIMVGNPSFIIKPSKKLTKTVNSIQETFSDIFFYMSKYSIIHEMDAIVECKSNQGVVQIIDYNIHDKQTQETLYAICEKKLESLTNKHIMWKTNDCLYTKKEIIEKYKISLNNLPKTSMNMSLMNEIEHRSKEIRKLLYDKKQRNNLLNIHNKRWNDRNKIPIFNKIEKPTKKAICLQITKEEFLNTINLFANNNHNIQLIPIIKFNNGTKYDFEMVWIVEIEPNINSSIGIALKIIKNKKFGPRIIATGIYLDINDKHKLLPYKHDCKCLQIFNCYIDILTIGLNKETRIHQSKMQQKLNKCQDKLYQYAKIRQNDTMVINRLKQTGYDLQIKLNNLQQFLQSLLQEQNKINHLNEQVIISTQLQQIQTTNNNISANINNLHQQPQ